MVVNRPQSQELGFLFLVLLAFFLPFELRSKTLTLGFFQLTNTEILLAVTAIFTVISIFSERRWQTPGWPLVPQTWIWLLVIYALVLIFSAILAPEWKLNAVKASGRSISSLAIVFIVPQLARSRTDIVRLIGALLAGGMLAAIMGLAEIIFGEDLVWLNLFRIQSTMVGSFMRLSATFDHANQAAMFIEATLPLIVVFGWLAWRHRRKYLILLSILAFLIYLEAAVLTFSRASYVTIAISNGLVGIMLLWRFSKHEQKIAYPWLITTITVIFLVVLHASFSSVLRLRLSSEGDKDWYKAIIEGPNQIDMEAGESKDVTVRLTNEGSLTWSSDLSQPINLGGRWFRKEDGRMLASELRWDLGTIIGPGDSETITIPLIAPDRPGEYLLTWDMIQEDVIWFSAKSGLSSQTVVNVISAEMNQDAAEEEFVNLDPIPEPIPDRRTLWRVASVIFSEKPLLGIGLDNFRLTYGNVLEWQAWNTSIHTNNWYIESLVSVGLLGSLPFFTWLILLVIDIGRILGTEKSFPNKMKSEESTLWQAAIAVGLIAFLIHGLLDYFMLFNGIALLFWFLVGLWVVLRSSNNNSVNQSW